MQSLRKPGRFLNIEKPGRFLNSGTRKVPGKCPQSFFHKSSQKPGRFLTGKKAAGTRKVPDLFGKIWGPGTRKVPDHFDIEKNFKPKIWGPGTRKVSDLFGKKKAAGREKAEREPRGSPTPTLDPPLAWPRALRGRTTCLADKTNHPVKRAESQ